jgi:hypothetical protein
MELKVVCGCGQKYAFDVEPVNGRMPVKIACPSCGVDGTASADQILGQHFPNRPAPIPVALAASAAPPAAMAPPPMSPPPAIAPPPPVGGLRINIPHHAPAPAAVPPPPPVAAAPMRPGVAPIAAPKAKAEAEYSVGLGILGAFIGAVVGAGLMYGFFEMTGFRFPLMGMCIGILTGLAAKLMARGTDMTLGAISGGIALLATGGALYFMFGEFSGLFLISMLVSVSLAYKIAG